MSRSRSTAVADGTNGTFAACRQAITLEMLLCGGADSVSRDRALSLAVRTMSSAQAIRIHSRLVQRRCFENTDDYGLMKRNVAKTHVNRLLDIARSIYDQLWRGTARRPFPKELHDLWLFCKRNHGNRDAIVRGIRILAILADGYSSKSIDTEYDAPPTNVPPDSQPMTE